jgi:hypothetical protein
MKIELKLTADQVFATARLLEQIYESKPTDIQQKLMRSIALDVADKYIKKQHSLYTKQNLFDAKKKHKITLKFHEAYALHSVIETLIYTVNDIYCNSILKTLLGNLNQKLA